MGGGGGGRHKHIIVPQSKTLGGTCPPCPPPPPPASYASDIYMDLIHINYDKLVASVDGIKKYDEVFSDEIGDLSGTVHLQVDENVTPIVLSARRLPVQYTSKIRKVGTVLFNDALNTFYLP